MIACKTIDSPVGPLLLAADDAGLRLIEFQSPRHPTPRGSDWHQGEHDTLTKAAVQLTQYFEGQRRDFDLPLSPRGTAFQLAVWEALKAISYGQTRSYRQQAMHIGQPQSVRAVGAANGRNPLPIVIPCHRAIGANGNLTGFGGGLPVKQFLLQLEGALPKDDLFATVNIDPQRG
ncbi:MAG: methylated-DNA--[protein]-cysteine S-methyltransferase [Lysobacter sp.]|nr:methylated-DNA--[protein]-cysteine S-methyltransferase [Lysobacter sp.]